LKAQRGKFSERSTRSLEIIVIIITTLVLLEGALRLQQKLGPIWDLSFDNATLEGVSDVINHQPLRKSTHILSSPEMYGEYAGYTYTAHYDQNGIRKNTLRPEQEHRHSGISVLFMGDSFMQGYDDGNTIPQHVWNYFQTKNSQFSIILYNAGCLSYSPAIFIPQAKILIPQLHPTFVVVDIDETDLGDDYIRYKNLIIRDQNGRIVAVEKTPIYFESNYGLIKLKEQPSYVARLFLSLYHKKIYMPHYIERYRHDDRSVFSFSRDKDENAEEKYKEEIGFFRSNVVELVETLIDLIGNKDRILLLYHPHLQHLVPDQDNRYWNHFVSNTVKDVAARYDIAFYDATEDLRTRFNGNPEQYYWNKNIHFNFDGLKVYGDLVAQSLIGLIEEGNVKTGNQG